MAILAFQKPDKVIMVESSDTVGKFEFRPLEPGYGITVGNALRRILLSSLEGYAITTVKVEGIDHEFSTIKGVIEDVTEVILNLKQIRFKKQIEEVEDEKIVVSLNGQNEFKAGDLSKFLNSFEVLNPDLIICRMESDVKLQIEIQISKGRGYVPAEENRPAEAEFGLISVDSIFVREPVLMITQPHQHEFPQYLCFSSSNPDDPDEFDAVVEISLGEEGEKHIIDSPTVVYVPSNLHHGPLNFKTINKPVLFVDVALSGQYTRIGNTED